MPSNTPTRANKHRWWRFWDDMLTSPKMIRWRRNHGDWIFPAWCACCDLANGVEKDGRLDDPDSGEVYEVFDIAQRACISDDKASAAVELFVKAGWLHMDGECMVVSNFRRRNENPSTTRNNSPKKRPLGRTNGRNKDAMTDAKATPEDRRQKTEGEEREENRESTPSPASGEPTHTGKPKGCKREQAFYDSLAAYWNEHKASTQAKAQTPSQPTCKRIDTALGKHELSEDDWKLRVRAVAADPWWNGMDGKRSQGLSFTKFWESAARVRDWTTYEDLVEQYQSGPATANVIKFHKAGDDD